MIAKHDLIGYSKHPAEVNLGSPFKVAPEFPILILAEHRGEDVLVKEQVATDRDSSLNSGGQTSRRNSGGAEAIN